jgi:hypothetical protein
MSHRARRDATSPVLDRVAVPKPTARSEPGVAATAVGLDIGIPVEVVAPTGPGAMEDYLDQYEPRVWGVTFSVRDLGVATEYFASKGITLEEGDSADTMMMPPKANLQVIYQFME